MTYRAPNGKVLSSVDDCTDYYEVFESTFSTLGLQRNTIKRGHKFIRKELEANMIQALVSHHQDALVTLTHPLQMRSP